MYTNSLSRVLWSIRLDNHFKGSAAQLHRTWEKSGATKQKLILQSKSHLTCFINGEIRSVCLQHKVGDGLEEKKRKGKGKEGK